MESNPRNRTRGQHYICTRTCRHWQASRRTIQLGRGVNDVGRLVRESGEADAIFLAVVLLLVPGCMRLSISPRGSGSGLMARRVRTFPFGS